MAKPNSPKTPNAVKRYRKALGVYEVFQYAGDNEDAFLLMLLTGIDRGTKVKKAPDSITFTTVHGDEVAKAGDWILRSLSDHIYVVSDSVFRSDYTLEPINRGGWGVTAMLEEEARKVEASKPKAKPTSDKPKAVQKPVPVVKQFYDDDE